MSYRIEIINDHPSRTWLKSYDPDGHDGLGDVALTTDQAEAMTFETNAEAIALYRTVSTTHPIRHDGKPNRPLTAYTISISRL